MEKQEVIQKRIVRVASTASKVCCPSPEDAAWREHPRVYLAFDKDGKVQCPYCSTMYIADS